jgi:hypothetical protein
MKTRIPNFVQKKGLRFLLLCALAQRVYQHYPQLLLHKKSR